MPQTLLKMKSSRMRSHGPAPFEAFLKPWLIHTIIGVYWRPNPTPLISRIKAAPSQPAAARISPKVFFLPLPIGLNFRPADQGPVEKLFCFFFLPNTQSTELSSFQAPHTAASTTSFDRKATEFNAAAAATANRHTHIHSLTMVLRLTQPWLHLHRQQPHNTHT